MTPAGVEKLREATAEYSASRERIMEESEPTEELMKMLRPLLDELGNEALMAMLAAGEIDRLAELTGRDAATIARLRAAWKREPIVEAALPALLELRRSVSRADWNAFRRFLLVDVAPKLSVVEYREER